MTIKMDTESSASAVRKPGKVRGRSVVILTVFLLISAIAATFLAVYLTKDEDQAHANHPELQRQEETCQDVAIIGAGVGGSYIAWRLRDQNLSVTVYEYSDRVGGRMHSVRFRDIPDISIELGAMRFLPDIHLLMNATAHAIGVSVDDFKPGLGLDMDTPMYVRDKHFKRSEATTSGPYNLKPDERAKDDVHLRWSSYVNGTNFSPGQVDPHNKTFVMYLKTKDGVELYKQSAKLAYTTIGLSGEAIELLRDTFGFYSYSGDISAATNIPAWNPDASSSNIQAKTIKEGMDQIPRRLMEHFLNASTRNHLRKNHRLKKIQKRNDGAFQLEFQETVTSNEITIDSNIEKTVCAQRVVLAVPKMALQKIEWNALRQTDIKDMLENSSQDSPAAKVFLAYNIPWWQGLKSKIKHSLSDRPNRQTYDFGTSAVSNRSVLLAVYTDMEDVTFWRDIQFMDNPYKNCSLKVSTCVSAKVVEYAHKFLSEIYNISVDKIPDPIDTAISLWDKYPYGAAWHVWRPGYIWNNVQDKMIQPVQTDNVFISSGVFTASGEGDSWAESALNAAELVLKRILQ